MSITKVEFRYKKSHLRYDADKGLWIGYRIDVQAGRKRHRNTFRTKGEAERFIDALRMQTVYNHAGMKKTDLGEVPPVSKLFAARLEEITNHKALIRAKRVFEDFAALLDQDLPVTSVQKPHFRLYINAREKTGVKPETINREINELSAAFNRARDLFPRELDDYEPSIARPRVKRGKRSRHEITDAEAAAIVVSIRETRNKREYPQRTASRPFVALMFELSWLLGLRIGEAEKLLKTDFNPKQRSLRVVRWKTGTATVMSFLPDRAVEILNESSAASSTDRVFDIVCSRHTVEDIIREACTLNNIPYGRNEIGGVTFHSTRHSFTSRLVRVTDPATAASFTGHSSLEMLDYYSHANEESKRLAMAAMYGKKGDEKLRKIFEAVRSGELDYEGFLAALK